MSQAPPQPQIQPCKYKTGKTLGAGSYSVVKECVHAETGGFYAAKVINKKLMAGKEHMVCAVYYDIGWWWWWWCLRSVWLIHASNCIGQE